MGERRGTKALELWCRRMTEGYPGVKIENMTTSWRDGLAFCAMIHHFRPDLIEFEKLNKDDVYYNNDLAFRTAERHLGIPALLDADDMASYEVPDRLSILTYLSQFYQVFASPDSHNRLNNKRPSAVTEKASIAKPTGPPPKMAHIVGVPKRDPCQKCSLPVFLAERLMIGKNVYHRTCLRCARCNSQLTLGSFYETEIDGEYCCETCPDEEKKLDVASSSVDSKTESSLTSKSIADRLAFFENDGTKVLQKSLSDEEKSQSLKKLTENQLQSAYKPNTALNSFMNRHLSDAVDSVSHNSSRRSSNSSTGSSSSNITDDDASEEPPELPKSLPPSSLEVDISGTPSLQPSEASLESSTVDSNVNVDLKSQDVHINSAKIENIENINTNQREPSAERLEQQRNDLTLSINVTKDSSEDDDQMRTKRDPTSVERCKESATTDGAAEQPVDGSPSTNRTSMVRARLHQFEVIANKSQESSISSLSRNRLSDHSKANRSSIDESPQSLETEVPKIIPELGSANVSPTIDSVANKEEHASYTFTEDKQEKTDPGNDGQESSQVSTIKPSPPDDNDSVEEITVQTHLSVDKVSPSALPSAEVLSDSSTVEKPVADSPSTVIHEAVESPKENKSAVQNTASTESLKQVVKRDDYPEELNPFKSDDEEDEQSLKASVPSKEKRKSLNPFESSDEECENDNKMKPPRPPPPKKVSTNPFGSESEDEELSMANSLSNSSGTPRRTPVPTPRNYKSTSQSVTPEPTPRVTRQSYDTPLKNTSDYYGSTSSLSGTGSIAKTSLDQFHRESEVRGSGRSLASSSGSAGGVTKSRKKKAPAPPPPTVSKVSKELFSPTDQESKKSSPGSSTATTPTPHRKKRPAPAPPTIAKNGDISQESTPLSSIEPSIKIIPDVAQEEKKDDKSPAQLEKLCDEEKALLEVNTKISSNESSTTSLDQGNESTTSSKRRLIALDVSLVEDANSSEDLKAKEEDNVVYRRTLIPPVLDDSPISPTSDTCESHDRQLEKMKDNKEAKNRNRQSQISLPSEENDPLYNKSVHGKWKRRKGPAPALPIPPKKVLQMLPLQEIRHELEIIEVQQQGLEKQGVMLEKMIRERCEGPTGLDNTDGNTNPPNSKEVEDLILQLFELVNEKNELFRRQAELMYLRRQHRLEQEQADLEYEIRVLMAQPERNKTDSDKAREEALIARLVEVVQLRNEVVECLEMDRLREAEEDLSIKQRLEMHSAKRDEELSKQTPTKLSKKEKKKQKEHKKIGKSKKLDADKDADESELNAEKQKIKKKKKKFLF